MARATIPPTAATPGLGHADATRHSLTGPPKTEDLVAVAQAAPSSFTEQPIVAFNEGVSVGDWPRPRDDLVAGTPDVPARSWCVSGCRLGSKGPSGRVLWDVKRSNPTASYSLAVLHAVAVVIALQPRLHRDDNAGSAKRRLGRRLKASRPSEGL